MTAPDHRVLTTALRGMPGVADADVRPDDEGGPGTLRIRLVAGADQAATAASVGRLLREQFGLGVYTDRVQILASQIVDDPTVIHDQSG